MTLPVYLPELGGRDVCLSVWFAEPGDHVFEGDRLVEVRLGPATFDVSAPVTGLLAACCARIGDPLAPGQLLATIVPDPEGL